MSIIDVLRTRTRDWQAATAAITDGFTEHRAAITAKRAEIESTRTALPPVAELIAAAEHQVDAAAELWWEKNERALLQGLAGRAPIPGFDDRTRTELPWPPTAPLSFAAQCALEPARVKAMLRDALRARTYTAGLPSAARPARLAALEAELAQLEAEEERLVDEAAAAGVVVAHRPEVIERRERESAQARRSAEAEAERRTREAAVDQRHATRVMPSPYLAANRRGTGF